MTPRTITYYVVEFNPAGQRRYWAVKHKKTEWMGVDTIFKAYRFSSLESAQEQARKLKDAKVLRVTCTISGID